MLLVLNGPYSNADMVAVAGLVALHAGTLLLVALGIGLGWFVGSRPSNTTLVVTTAEAAALGQAVDAAVRGQPLSPVWREEVEKVSHRHYSTGFYFGPPG